MWRKIILYGILSIFFIENIEVDSLTMWRIEYLHFKAKLLQQDFNDLEELTHFTFDSETMTRVNDHELIVEDEYYDIISEHFDKNGHQIYCKIDQEEGFLIKLVTWIRTNEKQDKPKQTSTLLKSKLKSLKYLSDKIKIPQQNNSTIHLEHLELKRIYISPALKIPVPPPIA